MELPTDGTPPPPPRFPPCSAPPTPQAILFLLGRPIMLPEVNTSFVLPHHVGTRGAMVTVGLSQDLFDSALLLLQKAGVLNMDITGQLVRVGPAVPGRPC